MNRAQSSAGVALLVAIALVAACQGDAPGAATAGEEGRINRTAGTAPARVGAEPGRGLPVGNGLGVAVPGAGVPNGGGAFGPGGVAGNDLIVQGELAHGQVDRGATQVGPWRRSWRLRP